LHSPSQMGRWVEYDQYAWHGHSPNHHNQQQQRSSCGSSGAVLGTCDGLHAQLVLLCAHSQGSLTLRQLAHSQATMMVFGRVSLGKQPASEGDAGGQAAAGAKSSGGSKSSDQADVAAAAAAWAKKLALTQPLPAPSLVVLRGPGVAPEVIPVKPGSAKELEKTIHDKGLMWQVGGQCGLLGSWWSGSLMWCSGWRQVAAGAEAQEMYAWLTRPNRPKADTLHLCQHALSRIRAIPLCRPTTLLPAACLQMIPALRPNTVETLRCMWGRAAQMSHSYPTSSSSQLCVVLVGRGAGVLDAGRRNMLRLSRLLAQHSTTPSRHPRTSAAAAALMDGRLRLTWVDAAAQPKFCKEHTRGAAVPATTRSGSATTGSTSLGEALPPAVCGGPRFMLQELRQVVSDVAHHVSQLDWRAAAAVSARLLSHHHPAVLLAYRPVPSGATQSSSTGSKYRFAVLPDLDMSDGSLSDQVLETAAEWVGDMHRAVVSPGGERGRGSSKAGHDGSTATLYHLPGSRFPSDLLGDDDPGALEFLHERVNQAKRWAG
jgi:hypothetical protein